MKIGNNLREIRSRERNYTQAYVAKQLGITTKAYSNLENNISDPTLSRLHKLAEILECDINCFLFDEKKVPINPKATSEILNEKKLYEDLIESLQKQLFLYEHVLNKNGIQI
jgi:transcriptional regulator with XRE-family HTH domain